VRFAGPSIPLLLLNHFPDDPVLDALLQFNVLIPGIERIYPVRLELEVTNCDLKFINS
jgi:hypothetical protein